MKTTRGKDVKLNGPAKRLFGYNYEVILKEDGKKAELQEEFDKSNLSEADLDKILAMT